MERREHFEIESSSSFSAPAIQVALNRGRCHPQRKTLRRVARPEDSHSQATVLGNPQVIPTTTSKRGMRANTTRHVLECVNVKTSAKLKKGVRRGRDGTSSLLVFRTMSQRGPCIYPEKVSGESHVIQAVGRAYVVESRIYQGDIC